jgi:4Fe-4S ferredoxin
MTSALAHRSTELARSLDCKHPAGVFIPVIDRNRCEGKAECVKVCPTHVFVVGTLPRSERKNVSFAGGIKGFVHRWQQALLIDPGACEGCARCVEACPENAITLARA